MQDSIVLQKDRAKVKLVMNFEDFHVNIVDYLVEEEPYNEFTYLVRMELELTSSNHKSDVANLKATYDVTYNWIERMWNPLDFIIRNNEFTDRLYQLLESNAMREDSVIVALL